MRNLLEPVGLKLDPWAASSLLQKAIRRGEVALSQYAARTLHHQRGNAIWRRLINIAVEDVGIADPDLLLEVVACATDRKLRQILGSDNELLDDLTRKLACAPKDRSADYLYCAATKLSAAGAEQLFPAACDGASEETRTRIQSVFDIARAALASCTTDGHSGALTDGEVTQTLLSQWQASCPRSLCDAVRTALAHNGHPFALMLPILWNASSGVIRSVTKDEIVPTEWLEGVPLYTFDKHTAVGKRAIGALVQRSEEIRSTLLRFTSPASVTRVAAMAAFYVDAVPVSCRLEWNGSSHLQELGMRADMIGAGCVVEGIGVVIDAVSVNVAELNALRRAYAKGGVRTQGLALK
jgi:hypothetical protein